MFKKQSDKSKVSKSDNTKITTTSSSYNTNTSKTSSQSTTTIIKITSSKSPTLDFDFKGMSLTSPASANTDQSARTKFFSDQPKLTVSAYRSFPATSTSQLKSYTKPVEIKEIKSFYRPPIIDYTPKLKNNNTIAFKSTLPYKSPYRAITFEPPNYNNNTIALKTALPYKSSYRSAVNNEVFPNYNTKPMKSHQIFPTPQLKKPIELASSTSKKLKPGVVYIFNQEHFDYKQTDRIGTKADVKNLKETFKRFKLEVNVYNDYKVSQIESKVRDIQRRDFTKHSCIVITILSHGNRRDEICARDRPYLIDDVIVFPMLQSKTLEDCTKIFLIQACKGDIELHYPHVDSIAVELPKTFYSPKEILKCYSTFEGFVSYRGKDGSVFIQHLCDTLARHGTKSDIESIMKMVIESVSKTTNQQQVPSICSSLTKPYIFGDYI